MHYPPIPQRKSCDCNDPCISTDDVYYAGPNLPNSGINTYNSVTLAIEKLDILLAIPTLQKVTDVGNLTTLPIIANSFVKIGGDGSNFLLDNGTVLPISDLPIQVTKTSELINDGQNGIDPFITLQDIPSQIVEVETFSFLPEFGEIDIIYITLDDHKLYIWQDVIYVEIGGTVTDLNYVEDVANGYVESSTGNSAELPLADDVYAGLFSPGEKIKLSGIQAGAQVNVNADWNATSGDALILNKPEIPSIDGLATVTYVDQQDDLRVYKNSPIIGDSKTKITYDDKGLVTSGENASTADINDSVNRRYTTDAQQTILGNTSGTNTGDQNLQTVTDIGSSTTNTISIILTNEGGNAFQALSSTYVASEDGGTTANLFISNGTTSTNPENAWIGRTMQVINTANGTAIETIATNGKSIVTYNDSGTAIEINSGTSNVGLVINSGTSSIGEPIIVNKNGIVKLVVNQEGELTATKLIKQGGTGLNVLLDDGNTATLASLGSQDLQEVTDVAASTTNSITLNPIIDTNGLNVNVSGDGTGINITANGSSQPLLINGNGNNSGIQVNGSDTGIFLNNPTTGLTIADSGNLDTAVYIYNTNGSNGIYQSIGVGIAENISLGSTAKGLVINSGTSSTGNIIEFNKNSVNKLTVNSEGATSIVTQNQTALTINSYSNDDDSIGILIPNSGTGYGLIVEGSTYCGVNTFGDQNGIIAGSSQTSILANLNTSTSTGIQIESDLLANGTPFKITKNSVDKLTVNQSGELTATKLIKNGGTGTQILAADGSNITAGDNISISGGVISSSGGGGGGGATVSYYLNGGTAASVAGYYQLSQSAVFGTGVNFPLTGNGLISQWLTDVGNPNKTQILGGVWTFETYLNASSVGGNPKFYIELLKYDGTTFTSIVSNSATPQDILNGASIYPYVTGLSVPQTTLLTTDRIALRYYIVNNPSRTITMYTQNFYLSKVVTTFVAGITSLNGLNAASQNFGIDTTGNDFNIISSGSTHTFYLPSAAPTARGVVTTTSQTFAGLKTFSNSINPGLGSLYYNTIAYIDGSGVLGGLYPGGLYPNLTELSYVKGVTNPIQGQFAGKQPLSTNLTTIAAFTTNGLLRYQSGTGIIPDTSTYLTANQTITLTGAVTGSGATAITTTLGTGVVGLSNLSATGTKDSTTYLRGDNTWATVSGGGGSGTVTSIAVSSPLVSSTGGAITTTGTISIPEATSSVNGYLKSTDWVIFNAKANTSSPTFTGTPNLPTGTIAVTQAPLTSSFTLATTEFVTLANTLKANLSSPVFTGLPESTTPGTGDDTQRIATTNFVKNVIDAQVFNIAYVGTANITTDYQSGSYNQNGRNLMIDNTGGNINLTVTTTSKVNFIASYTKLSPNTNYITFLAGTGTTLVPATTAVFNGKAGSTALLTRTGDTYYLQINNII